MVKLLMTSWFVLGVIFLLAFFGKQNLKSTPEGFQNFTEFVTEFIRDLAKTQIGEEDYLRWVPFLGTIFLFIFVSNWSGALLPWHVIRITKWRISCSNKRYKHNSSLSIINIDIVFLCRDSVKKV